MDGHEWPYTVRGNATKLVAGMTFTDEPGIYVPGELGIRHEDTSRESHRRRPSGRDERWAAMPLRQAACLRGQARVSP
jgi:hypothetical protein